MKKDPGKAKLAVVEEPGATAGVVEEPGTDLGPGIPESQPDSTITGEGQGQGYEGDPGVPESKIPTALTFTKTKENLKCFLTDAEIKVLAREAARANTDIQQIDDDLKAIKSNYKSRIDLAQAILNECSQKINQGFEFREVECHLIRDYQENSVTVIRLDTDKVVKQRAMTPEERQRNLEV